MGGPPKLGLWSGIGLVVANMVGGGVFLSAGFMAQNLGPRAILLAWVVGSALALAGARAYAELARIVPRSGGEYRILSDLLHPAAGYLAGWASALVGFAGPIAIDAAAAVSFLGTLFPGLPPKIVGAGLIAAVTCAHAFDLGLSARTQNALVIAKSLLLVGFVVLGLLYGRNEAPTWAPPGVSAGFPLPAFMASLFYVGFAFTGWNAAFYAAEEFEDPRRHVPRAMLIGCGLVAVLYLAVNWIFVANLTPERALVVASYEEARITLGHLVARDILGEAGGRLMSVLMIVALVSAMSAMTFAGPRVYASMARDGFLPSALTARAERPPLGSVLAQGGISIALLAAERVQTLLQNMAAILMLFSALTVACLFVVLLRGPRGARPATGSLVAGGVYIASACWMLYFGVRASTGLLGWIAVVVVVAMAAYALGRR